MKYVRAICLTLTIWSVAGCDVSQPAPAPEGAQSSAATTTADAPGLERAAPDQPGDEAGMWGDGALACGRPCDPGKKDSCGAIGCCVLSGSCGYMCGSSCDESSAVDDDAVACGRPCNPEKPDACNGGSCCLTPSCGYICGGTCGGGEQSWE